METMPGTPVANAFVFMPSASL